jgi:hypothetical protein
MFKRPACVIATSIVLTAMLLAAPVSTCHSVSASQDQEHISPPQMETRTIPLGYFELTVSPAEVYANMGEAIEIRCSIYCIINTPVEVSSVDMLLFDSYGSMIREQAMTKDSYWSAHTVYTIVGDEAYYQIKFNFSFISLSESGEYTKSVEYTEYTAHSFPIVVSQEQEPIEIVSVLGPVPPFTPGGPAVEITLKNVSVEPVISLTATFEVFSASGIPFDFTFDDVSPSNPLQPNRSTSDTLCLIGGGFSSNVSYPLTINATLQNGANFVYTKLVQIAQPPPNIWGLALAGVICALFQPHVAVLAILPIIFVYLSKSDLQDPSLVNNSPL